MSVRLSYEPSVQAMVAELLGAGTSVLGHSAGQRNRVSWPVILRATGLGRLGGGEVVIVPRGREGEVLGELESLSHAGVAAVIVDLDSEPSGACASPVPVVVTSSARDPRRLKEEIEEYVVRRRRELFSEDQRLHRLLVDAALGGATPQRLIELARREFSGPVILEAGSDLWCGGIERDAVPASSLHRADVETRQATISVFTDQGGVNLAAPVEAGSRRRGVVLLLDIPPDELDDREVLVSCLCAAAAIALSQTQETELPSLRSLLTSGELPEPAGGWACVVIDAGQSGIARVARALLNESAARGLDARLAVEDESLYCLVPAGTITPAAWLADVITRSGLPHLRAGVSRTGYPPAPSTVAVREAREALRSGRPGVTEYADIELESLLTSIGGWERFVAHTLDPVLERADLLATLDAYLRYAGNAARAAESLSIHRNTMRYRLSQCQALLGKDIDDANVAFAIQLALRLLKAHPDYLSGRGRSDH